MRGQEGMDGRSEEGWEGGKNRYCAALIIPYNK